MSDWDKEGNFHHPHKPDQHPSDSVGNSPLYDKDNKQVGAMEHIVTPDGDIDIDVQFKE